MKKSLILASSIAAILASPLANAAAHGGGSGATVYGKAHIAVNMNDDVNNSPTVSDDNWTVSSNSSRLGVKGSEDLGNGMKAVYKYELSYDVTDGGGVTGTNRNSYVGLAGGFGEVVVGRRDTPSKDAFYAAGNDLLGDSRIDLNGLYGFREVRQSNIIFYTAPKMGDLTIKAAIAPGEGSGAGAGTGGNAGDGLADMLSFGVIYKAGPIKAALGFTDEADRTGTTDDTLMDLGGSYKMDNMQFGLQYQTREQANNTDTTIFAIIAKFGFGNNEVIVNFGNTETEVNGVVAPTADVDSMGLALNHKFSKRTNGYVAYASSDTDSQEGLSLGLVHNF